jgi:hypothetical protein
MVLNPCAKNGRIQKKRSCSKRGGFWACIDFWAGVKKCKGRGIRLGLGPTESANGIARVPLAAVVRAIAPFLAANLIVLLLVSYIPALSTWLPSVVFGN